MVFLAIKIPDPANFTERVRVPGGEDCTLKLGEPENVHHVSCLGVSPKTHEAKQACGGGIIPPEPSRKGCNFRFIGIFIAKKTI